VTELPEPLVPPACDCRDLDGFMLNVERLMASELVALSTHEEIAAALFLWCRAWKQHPAASLPDDDKVLASFARLPLARFKKIKGAALRGFVRCSDGRLYHRVLAAEAINAFERKVAFQRKRNSDAERLRKWRASNKETKSETHDETQSEMRNETRFVAEGQGQGQGQGHKKEYAANAAPAAAALTEGSAETPANRSSISKPANRPPTENCAPEAELFRRGRDILGKDAGGIIKKLLAAKDSSVPLARAALETASTKAVPREYVAAIIHSHDGRDGDTRSLRERGEAW
jgi:uncharacterized protein YdaU (DUF1376 family)